MRYDLAAQTRRAKPRSKGIITFRPIMAPAVRASDLYAQVYAPVIAAWSEAIPALTEQYSATLSAMTRDSPEQISSTIGSVESDATRVVLTVRLRLSQWALRFEAWHRARWRGVVKAATGIDIANMIGGGDVRLPVQAAIERNVSLVRSVSEQVRQRVSEAVFGGLNRNATAADVAKDIRAAVDLGRARSKRIASDQLVKINAQLNSDRAQEAGLEYYEWVSSNKVHFRPEHHARNGKRFKYGEPAGDEPGMAISCGCTARAVLSLDGEY